MAVFNKKTTLVHHITYMGIMAAINFIFVLLATFIPAFMFLLILILPFASTIVSYYCLKKYYIIYAVASVVLCLITGNFADTIFYVVPAIITGFVIGVLLGKKINPFWLILVSSLIESLLTFAFIPLINLIIHDDIVALFLNAFRITNFAYKTELTYLFVYFISLLQCSLSHFIMFTDSKKIGIEINTCIPSFIPFIIGDELCIALCFVFAFFYTPIAFVMAAISIYFSIFLLI